MKTWHTSEGLDLGTHTLWYVGSWTLAYGGLDMQSLTLVKELMNMVSLKKFLKLLKHVMMIPSHSCICGKEDYKIYMYI